MLGTQPTGRANARPMTGSAKQSMLLQKERMDCFVAALLAMTEGAGTTAKQQPTFAGTRCSEDSFATRAAFAIPASAAIFFCVSEPGCTTPADMIRVAASSALTSPSTLFL